MREKSLSSLSDRRIALSSKASFLILDEAVVPSLGLLVLFSARCNSTTAGCSWVVVNTAEPSRRILLKRPSELRDSVEEL